VQIVYIDKKYRFVEIFDQRSGINIQSGILDENGRDTGINPFQRSYPRLIDVGIMGHCIHGKYGLCVKSGVQCYQSGASETQPNMLLSDYQSIIDQSAGKLQSVALGGRGDPNKHERFQEILEYTVDHNIVPNYTTSGLNLTHEEVYQTALHCGAVAVSWYRSPYTLSALDAFCSAGVTTNIHYVLSRSSIDEAIQRLESNNWFGDGRNRINAVIFLLHKPVGQGSSSEVLDINDPRVSRFFSLVENHAGDYQLGFDSCSIPAIVNFSSSINPDSIDTCEGARFSMYITPDMFATPCSFDQNLDYAVSLRVFDIEEAWNGPTFESFRGKLRTSCPSCSNRSLCMGGCPLQPSIVLCGDKK